MFVSNGTPTAGVEVNMAREFSKVYKLNMTWFNANFVWGAFDSKIQRY